MIEINKDTYKTIRSILFTKFKHLSNEMQEDLTQQVMLKILNFNRKCYKLHSGYTPYKMISIFITECYIVNNRLNKQTFVDIDDAYNELITINNMDDRIYTSELLSIAEKKLTPVLFKGLLDYMKNHNITATDISSKERNRTKARVFLAKKILEGCV